MSWASRAAANLLPLSRAQHDLRAALAEWRYAGTLTSTHKRMLCLTGLKADVMNVASESEAACWGC